MKGVSYLTDEAGQKKAVVIDLELLQHRESLADILEDIEDAVAIETRKDEASIDWEAARQGLLSMD
ncbi:MAG: hypothetical protein ACO1N1_14300 [Dyadobacter fermentans]